MSLREIKKEKTALKAIEAIKRIQDGKPNHRKLLNRDNLKLNQHTVEQEAGLAVGALKHHDDILTMISDINLMGCEQEKTTGTQTDIYLLKQEIIKLKAQKKAAITGKKDAIALKKSYAEQLETLKYENKMLHQHHAEVVSALFDLIPQEDREGIVIKAMSHGNTNVVPIKS